MKSMFDKDLKESAVIDAFLDKYFYARLKEDGVITDYKRNISNLNEQYRGIDVVVENHGKDYFIDEKAQAHYRTRPLETFAFEVSYVKDGEIKCGWLIDNNKATEFWLMIWPYVKKQNSNTFCEDDIVQLDVMLIKRTSALAYLESYNWSKENIGEFSLFFRKEEKSHIGRPSKRVIEHFGPNKGLFCDEKFYWYISSQLSEAPINIVVRKKEIEKFAASRYIVKKEGYRKIE